ncbi:MAG: hypothetical protein IJ864_01570 [Alphaproteobacteria bacterium]|nr:hypothetical protein [Alphaproteobacteria bacterium]
MKENKILTILVLMCLGLSGYSVWQGYTLKDEVEKLRQERVSTNQSDDILNEALKIIQGKSGENTQPVKKKGLIDKAKSAAEAKALDMVANKVKKSVQENAETSGKDASTALKGIDMIFAVMQKAIDAEEGNATEADVARELFSGLRDAAKESVQENSEE